MNQVTPESKNTAIKTLAILGFVVMIILAVWIAVQLVRLIPSAFTSLADLAGDVQNAEDKITLEEETLVTNAGETLTINFDGVSEEGSYAFSYECTDGVAVAIVDEDENKEFIACDEEFEIAGDEALILAIASEKERSVDLSYSIIFTPETGEAELSTTGKLTIVNSEIPVGTVATNDDEEDEETPTVATSTPTVTPVKPTPAKPVTTIKYVSQIPTSDPKGYSDLAIKLLSSTSIDADEDAEIKIEVKNLGTKTSEEFDVTIELPDGSTEKITNEKGLKPNERATYTIEFDASELEGRETIEGEVEVDEDKMNANNSFETSVRIED